MRIAVTLLLAAAWFLGPPPKVKKTSLCMVSGYGGRPFSLTCPPGAKLCATSADHNQINEVYLSFTSQNSAEPEQQEIEKLIELLHKSHIRVEALLSSTDADEPGKHRDKLMGARQ